MTASISFLFDFGYCSYLGVPGRLIDVPWGGAILAGLVIALILFPALGVLLHWEDRRQMRLLGVFQSALLIIGGLLSAATWSFVPFGFIGTAAIMGLPWVYPKMESYLSLRCDKDDHRPGHVFFSALAIFGLLVMAFTAFEAGQSSASKQAEFVTIANSNFVLAGAYGDKLAFAQFDDDPPGTLTGVVKIMTTSDAEKLDLVWRRVGPLRSRPGVWQWSK
jgi:hypothetical protein